jgi:hypothetical protein
MDWAAVVTMAAFSGQGCLAGEAEMIRGLIACQPTLTETGDEIGSYSPVKVLLAGAGVQTLKKISTQKRGTTLINRMVPL